MKTTGHNVGNIIVLFDIVSTMITNKTENMFFFFNYYFYL